ncbi:S-adenosyl-L-methionine-dependent methyltransferase [Zychaea mexicana]|uniref:S-adenosyl-L-methionine-dependent methyltransferase n=1 Tax=Zychaea mexicana TaxID=64656 RepID=UPI0022FE0645|nr:S-adenosyl-L-methionine-dependent methyltransferase [Zychaea mexicana]KAI9494606.1 S-adenosyl-L-methionine-dependent methyltransferase [Zychaea mexicana]
MSSLHPTAANGFDKQADAYAQTRPSYPKESLDQLQSLVPDVDACIVDLAAGTGIFTKLLVDRGYKNVTAVEPVEAMREKLKSFLPNVPTLNGTSWEIPLPSESQDAVVVAQAFHWFSDLNSLKEIRRVLKPNGYFIMIWNLESPRSLWVRGLRNIYERYEKSAPQYRTGAWRAVFEKEEASDLFQLPLNHARFENDFLVRKENIFTRVNTKSYIAILSDEQRGVLTKEMESILDDPANGCSLDDQGLTMYPHDTDTYWTQRRN